MTDKCPECGIDWIDHHWESCERIAALKAENAALKAEVAALKERLEAWRGLKGYLYWANYSELPEAIKLKALKEI